jgi:tRNA pseudouridine(55) synthase
MYSSKTVKGKALFVYARDGEKVKIPKRKVFVKSLKMKNLKKIKSEQFLKNISKRIQKVKGDFRQAEILKIWKKNLSKPKEEFFIADFKIVCGSGTYVRSIANSLGENLNIPALAFSIRRTKLGKWRQR